MQPILVVPMNGGRYRIVAGERRWRAARMAGLDRVPCIIREMDVPTQMEIALVENLQREDLNIFEEAAAIAALINLYGLTQEEVAAKLSASQSYVANKLRLLRFGDAEQKLILEKKLTERHARALLRISDEKERRTALETVIERGLNVAETEEYITRLVDTAKQEKPPVQKRTAMVRDVRIFYNTIDRAVDIMNRAGIDAKTQKRDLGDTWEVTIRIPKAKEA